MWKIIFQILIAISVGVVAFYLLPAELKEKGLAFLSAAIPDSVAEKMAPIIFTPVERREKLITKLEDKITRLKKSFAAAPKTIPSEEISSALQETEQIIAKIKEANKEQGPINKITTTIVEKATGILSSPSVAPVEIKNSVTPNCDH